MVLTLNKNARTKQIWGAKKRPKDRTEWKNESENLIQ